MVRINSIEDPRIIKLLSQGKVGVLPTDTVYGLVCSAANKLAVERLYSLKGRKDKPGTLIAANIEQIIDMGVPKRYLTAVENFWPNPISIIIPTTQELSYLDLGKMSLAMRIPADLAVSKLLSLSGPLMTTSANTPGEPSVANIEEAEAVFGKSVDFYVNGDDFSGKPASTVIRIIDDAIDVLRQGAAKINEKGEVG